MPEAAKSNTLVHVTLSTRADLALAHCALAIIALLRVPEDVLQPHMREAMSALPRSAYAVPDSLHGAWETPGDVIFPSSVENSSSFCRSSTASLERSNSQ